MSAAIAAPTLAEIEAARSRLSSILRPNPIVRCDDAGSGLDLWLALENLSPIGSFKLRGAGNALLSLSPAELADGVVTASAGNMAQGIAWHARRLGVPVRVVVPDGAPAAKLERIRALGGKVFPVPFSRWWQVLEERGHPDVPGRFVHPVADADVIAGNATLGLDLLDAVPDPAAVLVPFGGGGLSSGVAAALRARGASAATFACEVEGSAPFAAALEAGAPTRIERVATFVDGIGSSTVLEAMWPLASELLAGALVVPLEEVSRTLRWLVQRAHVVAEGAGAVAPAAARSGVPGVEPGAPIVAVVSGGNIDPHKLAEALRGSTPAA